MSKRRSSRDKPRKHGTHRHLAGASDSFLQRNPHVRTLLSRIDQGGLTWEDVASDILPVFERARPFTYEVEPPAHAVVPPGVTIGFGVDLGLAFARVGGPSSRDGPSTSRD